jgi:hypothetical protein
MATLKAQGRTLGKLIRKETGLALPLAMRAAKLIVRGREWDISSELRFPRYFGCGPECCGFEGWVLRGPKGDYKL